MSVNNFGCSVNNKESDSILFSNLKSELLNEIDKKYLDKSEGDKLYLNEPITENVDLKNKKIINSD